MNTSRIKVLGLLGLPLLALAVAVMVFAWGSSTDTTQAASTGPEMKLDIKSGAVTCPAGKAAEVRCAGQGQAFTLSVEAVTAPATGYILAQSYIDYGSDLIYKKGTATGEISDDWLAATVPCADLTAVSGQLGANQANNGCLTGLASPPPSFHVGNIFDLEFNCSTAASTTIVQMLPFGDPSPVGTSGTAFKDAGDNWITPKMADLEVQCVPPPTSTPTATPPPIPKMSKSPALSNHWLQALGDKIPPTDCLAGTATTLTEALSQSIVSPDPKSPSSFQLLGAFEFEVHYDNKKVCVDLEPGAGWDPFSTDPNAPAAGTVICIVEDDEPDSKPQLEGVARIGCVTVGKSVTIDDTLSVATVDVYPQPEVYSQAKPNQDNGVVVQINNVNCDLGDVQGHAIPIFSCDDADITFRYLEGDVHPDCVIDATDAQSIAFRWGVEKGSLIYTDFMNLEPSGAQSDNDIDINDLQFVFGRFGSICSDGGTETEGTHPAQVPVNPKASGS